MEIELADVHIRAVCTSKLTTRLTIEYPSGGHFSARALRAVAAFLHPPTESEIQEAARKNEADQAQES